MKFINLEKIHEGKFIKRYDLIYETELGNIKKYEMISRKNFETFGDLVQTKCDAVVLIMHNENGDKILLSKEFRMATGKFVYNFPAGLIDNGESVVVAATRELKEETGLDIIEITDIWPESYSAVGFANEKTQCVLGVAGGEFMPSTSDEEEIEAGWYTKDDVLNLVKEGNFASRTQAYCLLWARSK